MGIRLSLFAAVAACGLVVAAPALAGTMSASRQHRIETLIARAHAADAKGRMDDATMLMQSAIVADPARAASYVSLANLYARHGDAHFAHKYYDEALYLNPTLPAALEGAGKADLALGDNMAAKAKLTRLKKSCRDCEQISALEKAIAAPGKSRSDSMDKK